jgi:hypothetical protein
VDFQAQHTPEYIIEEESKHFDEEDIRSKRGSEVTPLSETALQLLIMHDRQYTSPNKKEDST